MGDSKKVMLIGWDAADWKIINRLMDQGLMPTVTSMVEKGTMGNMRTLSPVLSPMLWTSIATGKRPYKHGIYGFTEPAPNGKSVRPMTNLSRRSKAIWNILNQNDMQSIVVGWWPSHPAEPINGVMVSDYFHKAPKKPGDAWPLLPSSIHPASLVKEIAELRVHPTEMGAEDLLPFIPEGHEIDQTKDARVAVLMKMLAECSTVHSTATHLLETQPWDFAAIYYDAIDHFCHGFMKYHPPKQDHVSEEDFRIYQHVVTTAYAFHDLMLKRLMEFAGEDTTVLLVSDHGFHPDHLRLKQMPSEPAGPAMEHRDYGIFLAQGPEVRKDHLIHKANLLDIAPTILTIYGLPLGEDMDGQPLLDMFEMNREVETIPSWEDVPGEDGQHDEDKVIDPEESQAVMDQLVALGYIDAPDEDADLAIKHTTRELDYNLARAYMDADLHGEAVPLLAGLYRNHPLEFRFGIQLANCLRATGRNADLKRLVDDLNGRWRVAAEEARKRLGEVAQIAKERKEQWQELKKIDDQNMDNPDAPKLAKETPLGRPQLFEDHERHTIRSLRAVVRGNPQTLDFLAATVAIAEDDFEAALEYLKRSRITESRNPGFQFHIGNVYLGLERYEEAEAAFRRGLELDEYHPTCLMGLCRTYVLTEEFEKALDFGQQAIGLKYHAPLAHFFLSRAQNALRDYRGAVRSLKTALDQNPNFVEAHRLLARIYSDAFEDENLAEEHRALAEKLVEDNAEVVQTADPLELPEMTQEDFRQSLPTLSGEEFMSDEFERCLAQPKVTNVDEPSREADPAQVIVVSGLPRSGTSMMMQMLAAGGLEIFTDEAREADPNNPKGYYEANVVKQLNKKNKWIAECDGKVVKVVAPLIPFLPQSAKYRVVFMQRDIDEIVESQAKMLERLQTTGGDISDERLAAALNQQMQGALAILAMHRHAVLKLAYQEVVADPGLAAAKLADFLGVELDLAAMEQAVDPALYRQRRADQSA